MGKPDIIIMKRCILLLISIMFISSISNAQYRINKTKYDYLTYTYKAGDKYYPPLVSFASIIPGLGQMISGEFGRGAAIFACFAVVFGAGAIGSSIPLNIDLSTGAVLMFVCLSGLLAIEIFSIADAGRVAKINNLAWRDKNKSSYNFQLQPFLNITDINRTGIVHAGITLAVTF